MSISQLTSRRKWGPIQRAETTDKSMHCAGAMIVLEHEELPDEIIRIAVRLGFYDHKAL